MYKLTQKNFTARADEEVVLVSSCVQSVLSCVLFCLLNVWCVCASARICAVLLHIDKFYACVGCSPLSIHGDMCWHICAHHTVMVPGSDNEGSETLRNGDVVSIGGVTH